MGDRTTRFLPCPMCGKESEQYDAPSCLLWVWNCEHCGWKDSRNYYEVGENIIQLLTEEQAKKQGLKWVDGLTNALLKDKGL